MNMFKRTWLLALLTLFSTTTTLEVVAEGIGGSGRAVGTVSRFASVVVGGVRYDVDAAQIRINGELAEEHDLKVGNRVVIVGDLETQVAHEVLYFDTVAGAIGEISVEDEMLGVATLTVMGQRVQTSGDTWFHGTTLGALAVGDQVAVSGALLPDGSVAASSLERVARHLQVVSGAVAMLDEESFSVGTVIVDADAVDEDAGVDPKDLRDGELVHVLGHDLGNGRLRAVAIVPVTPEVPASSSVLMEGALHLDGGVWSLDGLPLELDGSTIYLAGKSEDLAPGVQVAVRGVLNADGALRVLEMEFEDGALSRLDGPITAVAADGATITINDVQVPVDEKLSMLDERDGYRWFAPADLAHYDNLSVVVEERDGQLRAARVLRRQTFNTLLKATVENSGWTFEGLSALRTRIDGIDGANEARIDGLTVPGWMLKWLVRDGDELVVVWDDDGNVDTVSVTTRAAE